MSEGIKVRFRTKGRENPQVPVRGFGRVRGRTAAGLVRTYPRASGSLVGGLETSRLLEDQLLQLLLGEVVQLHGESKGLLRHWLQERQGKGTSVTWKTEKYLYIFIYLTHTLH